MNATNIRGSRKILLDSCPGMMQKEVEDQMDMVEAYKMMNTMCEDEGVKELNL